MKDSLILTLCYLVIGLSKAQNSPAEAKLCREYSSNCFVDELNELSCLNLTNLIDVPCNQYNNISGIFLTDSTHGEHLVLEDPSMSLKNLVVYHSTFEQIRVNTSMLPLLKAVEFHDVNFGAIRQPGPIFCKPDYEDVLIRKLVLSGCGLSSKSFKTFIGDLRWSFPELTHLDLSKNKIRKLENAFFPTNIREVNLSGNMIFTVSWPLLFLSDFESMTHLDLSQNGLVRVDPDNFPPNLYELDLSHNRIRLIDLVGFSQPENDVSRVIQSKSYIKLMLHHNPVFCRGRRMNRQLKRDSDLSKKFYHERRYVLVDEENGYVCKRTKRNQH